MPRRNRDEEGVARPVTPRPRNTRTVPDNERTYTMLGRPMTAEQMRYIFTNRRNVYGRTEYNPNTARYEKEKTIENAEPLMKDQLVKHPRTLHLPWSEGATKDDRILKTSLNPLDMSYYFGKLSNHEVVVTVKMDGENTTLYKDSIHARSINGYSRHASRDHMNALHAKIRADIPYGLRICGENMYAKHSIAYKNLPSHFLVHSIWFDKNTVLGHVRDTCLSWDETVGFAELLGLTTVPVLYRGMFSESHLKTLFKGQYGGDDQEGYVVRRADSFDMASYEACVAKYVRKDHVQTSEHWMYEEMIKNELKKV